MSVVNNTSEAEPNDSESTAANPVVSLEQPSGDGAGERWTSTLVSHNYTVFTIIYKCQNQKVF